MVIESTGVRPGILLDFFNRAESRQGIVYNLIEGTYHFLVDTPPVYPTTIRKNTVLRANIIRPDGPQVYAEYFPNCFVFLYTKAVLKLESNRGKSPQIYRNPIRLLQCYSR